MFFAFFVAAGLIYGWVRGGSLYKLAHLPLRYGWVIVLALATKAVIFSSLFAESSLSSLAPPIYLLVNLLLLAGILFNRSLPGMKLIGLGLLLNFVAIAANGGYMPVSPAALEAAGHVEDAARLRSAGKLVTVREMTDDTKLALLGDRFALPPPLPFRGAISIGDVLIGAGAFWLVAQGMHGMQERQRRTDVARAG